MSCGSLHRIKQAILKRLRASNLQIILKFLFILKWKIYFQAKSMNASGPVQASCCNKDHCNVNFCTSEGRLKVKYLLDLFFKTWKSFITLKSYLGKKLKNWKTEKIWIIIIFKLWKSSELTNINFVNKNSST